MSVNKIHLPPTNSDEAPEGPIKLIKKNMKIPSTIKLVGIMSDKSFDIFRKNKIDDGPLIRVMYAQNVSYEIIRHSNTRMMIKESSPEGETENYVEFTVESSYTRDLIALVFEQLNEIYLEQISKSNLTETDFFKRREAYLENQISTNLAKYNADMKAEKEKHKA